jgi:hypothetical protein
MFRTVADVQTAYMLDLPRPALATGKPHVIAAPASETLKDYIKNARQARRTFALEPRRSDP